MRRRFLLGDVVPQTPSSALRASAKGGFETNPPSKPPKKTFALTAVVALVFGVGATVGDIGSCGKSPEDLDAATFAAARKNVDCERCTECGLTTQRCVAACADAASTETFPPNCEPLYQDGLVCLRALLAASCGDYAQYVDDNVRLVPTECEFCRGGVDAETGQ